jgi:hypothetical protein
MKGSLTICVLAAFAFGCSTKAPVPAQSVPKAPAAAGVSQQAPAPKPPPVAIAPVPVTVAQQPAVKPPAPVLSGPAVGQTVQKVIEAAAGQRIQFFDSDGKNQKELPKDARGSVSIHTRDRTGQDNYTFNEKGVITKHLRSHGDNYKKGVWEEVR